MPNGPRNINYFAGRIATFLGIAVGVVGALIPIIADTDWTDTTAVLGGTAAAIVAIRQFIIGAQKHEDRIADPATSVIE